jgi:YidC/Oxa1 family membrane protein insertase
MEKRVILFICLAAIILIGSQLYKQKYVRHTRPPRPADEIGDQRKEFPERPAAEMETPVSPAAAALFAADTKASPLKTTISGDFYQAVADNKGAVLTNWRLMKYKTSGRQTFDWKHLRIETSGRETFEMISASQNGESGIFPGTIFFRDSKLTSIANKELYEVTVNGARQDLNADIKGPATVEMKLVRSDMVIKKRFVFDRENYLVDLSVSVQKGEKPLDFQFFVGQEIGTAQERRDTSSSLQAIYHQGGKAKREGLPKDESQPKRIEGESRWVGLDVHYFAIIAIPAKTLPYFQIQKQTIKTANIKGEENGTELLKVTAPSDGFIDCKMYLGPKEQSVLAQVKAADISGVIDYGMFTIIVMPLLTFLRWINQYVNNFGYAIIILTFLLSLILFPFRLKQMLSMKKMQAVQPKVKVIQEKYRRYKKTDPKRAEMNQEIMALYKEHNVNPLGGCLPLVLQMPLLFAFYSLLQYSIELRHAPFIWFIKDLSVKDPSYALPIIMGITMFISQKMTPMTPGADPTASKMMTIMPAIFTIMFLNVSSGLNLYFLCSNIFQVAFQKIAERWTGDGKARAQSKS